MNNHGEIKNIEAMPGFIEDVNNKQEAKINVVNYGIEGQRGVKALTYDGQQIYVSSSVDDKLIEEYTCKKIETVIVENTTQYLLKNCTFNDKEEMEEIELLSERTK